MAIQEAKQLLAAAGYPNGLKSQDMLVRDLPSFRLWSQAIQAMLQQTIGVEIKIRMAPESTWFDDSKSGNFDLALGVIISTLLDPSDYFRAWYSTDGPQNNALWDNKQFMQLLPKIDRETDPAKRPALIREAEKIIENDPPLLPISWEKINDAWYNYGKGIRPDEYFGLYDVNHYDVVRLDK